MPRHFLSMFDLARDELFALLDRTAELKRRRRQGLREESLAGRSVALVFEKSSTRTRVSFEVGVYDLGGHPLFLSSRDMQLGRGESIEDTARVLSSYVDGVVIRTYGQERIEEFARHSSVSVINALTDSEHPCQIVSDLFTITEAGLDLPAIKLAYFGDGNNVANSLVAAAGIVGFTIYVATPPGFEPDPEVIERARAAGCREIVVTDDPALAARSADVIYTDVWVSMGDDEGKAALKERFVPYQVNASLLALAKPHALVMHCLPAHRGEEITADVMEAASKTIFTQAENRLHGAKAIMELFFTGSFPGGA